jgi:hypothetical protein
MATFVLVHGARCGGWIWKGDPLPTLAPLPGFSAAPSDDVALISHLAALASFIQVRFNEPDRYRSSRGDK